MRVDRASWGGPTMSMGRVAMRRKKRGPGRPSKLTDPVRERIMNTIRCGGSFRMAALAAGIGETTFQRWKSKGEAWDAPPEYRRFFEELKQAEAEGNAARVAIVMKAARTDWKAAGWLLERRLPELFSIKYQMEVGVPSPQETLAEVLRSSIGPPVRRQYTLPVPREPEEDKENE